MNLCCENSFVLKRKITKFVTYFCLYTAQFNKKKNNHYLR